MRGGHALPTADSNWNSGIARQGFNYNPFNTCAPITTTYCCRGKLGLRMQKGLGVANRSSFYAIIAGQSFALVLYTTRARQAHHTVFGAGYLPFAAIS